MDERPEFPYGEFPNYHELTEPAETGYPWTQADRTPDYVPDEDPKTCKCTECNCTLPADEDDKCLPCLLESHEPKG